MARPRDHDDRTRVALLDAAEAIVAESGPHALSVRTVADRVGTTTRAVYSVFGSKGGLLAALARRTFAALREGLESVPVTDDPAADLVACGSQMYRDFVREHPSLYRIAFQRAVPGLVMSDELLAAREDTWAHLEYRLRRLQEAGRLPTRDVRAAAVEFNAMCEGLANAELRGGTMRQADSEQVWREAIETVVRGLTR